MIAVYILYSLKLDRFYIGSAKDLDSRIEKHANHYFGDHKFTSKADDWKLFLMITCDSINQARKVEAHIKRMKSKVYVENLKLYPELITKLLHKYK